MAGFVFLSFLSVSCLLFPCEGKVFAPSAGSTLTFTRNSTESRIVWSFDDIIDPITRRIWSFTPTGQSQVVLAIIDANGPTKIFSNLLEFSIEEAATLVLKNVNLTYNGTYQFFLSPSSGVGSSEVVVFIAVAPSVSLSCSSPITRIEGDNVTCACRGQGGNPPADVTWFKDGDKIGETGKEEKTLNLKNVDRTASGTYKCVAQSHTLKNEKSIEMIVYFTVSPKVKRFTSTPPESAVFGKMVEITCEAIAVPLPSYIIIHNNTEIVSTNETYIIIDLNYSDAGSYECIATNHLGNSSKIFNLSVTATRTTKAPITSNLGTGECDNYGTKWYVVVGSIMSGIIIGLFLAYILLCARRRWFTIKKPERHVKPGTTEVDSTYQELDLTKMNKEDNYQSLRVNAASNDAANDDDSNYAELSKTRDVEDNYQSLT